MNSMITSENGDIDRCPYEKALTECKKAFRKDSDGIMTSSEERAIDYAFKSAFRLGIMADDAEPLSDH